MFFLANVAHRSLFLRRLWVDKKVHMTAARARFALQKVKKLGRLEHCWKMGSAKCVPDCSESSIQKNTEKTCSEFGVARSSLLSALRERGSTWCDASVMRVCNQQSMSDAATLLASGIAAGGCYLHCNSCAKGSS